MSDSSPFRHPERIGPYHLLQVIGEGGMGIVFEAEQTDPVRRRVAVKMMKGGVDTRDVVARFEAERQALAVMDHPGIAKVFDAGVTEQGSPYFAMELVRGIRLDEYCDQRRLTTRGRVELFVDVCEAVQHAHQKGVIHRDLKPSNVLVTESGGGARPKVIDFGVAKASGRRLTEETVVTTYGQALGTLAYMSPEQAEMTGLDVDTRADIYSLGVTLFELLAGSVPVDPKEMGAPAFLAKLIQRDRTLPTLRERLSAIDQDRLRLLADLRGTDSGRLQRELSSDLQWIVLKAADKDRSRRYETVNGLAADLRRYLADEPVAARAPTTVYRLTKFIRRNRVPAALGALSATALLVGALAATAGLIRAREAEEIARQEAQTAEQVSELLVGMFEFSDPSEALGNEITVREVLDSASTRVPIELAGQPEVQARLVQTMGEVYRGLGLYDRAGEMLESALELRRVDGEARDPSDIAHALYALGTVRQAESKLDEADSLFREAIRLFEDSDESVAASAAGALLALASVRYDEGDYLGAEPLFLEGVAALEAARGPDHPELASAMNNIGELYHRLDRFEDAERAFTESLVIREATLGPHHPDLASTLNNLATLHYSRAQYGQAEQYFRRSLAIRERVLDAQHPDLATGLGNLAVVLQGQSKYLAADTMLRRALDIRERALGSDHPAVANTLHNVAWGLYQLARYEEAESVLIRSIETKERALGPDHPSLAVSLSNLGLLYKTQERFEEAEVSYERTLVVQEAAVGAEHSTVAVTVNNLASLYHSWGRLSDAEPLYRRSLAIREATLGPDHPGVATVLNNLGRLATQRSDLEGAEALLIRSIDVYGRTLDADDVRLANPMANLARVHLEQGRLADAEGLLRDALVLTEEALGVDHPNVAVILASLATVLREQGQVALADSMEARAASIVAARGQSDR